MTTDTEQLIAPPSQTTDGNAPDADEAAKGIVPGAGANVLGEPSIREVKKADAAMDATQAVRDYAETKRA
jgi:hypothetical protein